MKPHYEAGGVTLFHARCEDVLPGIAAVDHVITDPPYEAEAHTLQRRVKGASGERRGTGGDDRVASVAPLGFAPMTEAERLWVGAEAARVVRRWALVFCQVEAAMLWRSALDQLAYRRTCIWVKPDGQPQLSGDRPGMGYESIVACHTKGRSRWNGGGRVGVFVRNKNGAWPNEHPTQKPLSLMLDLVRLFTDEGETILDPFAGSGTTLVAAWRLGRKAIGVEKSEPYAEVAARRLEREMAQGRLFEPGDKRGTQDALPLGGAA